MTLVIPEGYASIIHSFTWGGDPEPMAITYGVSAQTAGPGDVGAVASECSAAFIDACMNGFNDVLTLMQTEAKLQAAAPPADPVIGVDATTEDGAISGTVLPQNSALLAHKRTAFGGRGGRGRFYIPGVNESYADNLGNVESSVITNWNTRLAALLTNLAVGPLVEGMVLLHDDQGALAATAPYPVTTMTLDPVIATQRRRLRR